MSVAVIIPARYASTRFPGKPLAVIDGKPMIQRVYEQVAKVAEVNYIAVATDNSMITEAVNDFGGNVVMTNSDHKSGTDRCAEAALMLPELYDHIINVQGDEPFIHPVQISQVIRTINNPNVKIATLIRELIDPSDVLNLNKVKVVVNKLGEALYFSRQAIPYYNAETFNPINFRLHVGIYGFALETLLEISKLKACALEGTEQLEQLRWLWHGYSIHTEVTKHTSTGIDTPEDLKKALSENGIRSND